MSTTDVLSTCSPNDMECDEKGSNFTPIKYKNNGSPKPSQILPDEVQEDIEDMLDNVPSLDKTFTIVDKIGEGTFSSVYMAKIKSLPQVKDKFALKHIIPTSHPARIERELRCLKEIGGCDNVIAVNACLRERDHVVIVMPYFPHDRFQDYVYDLTVPEVREYMRNLLLALRKVHTIDIIHRDVKPSNFLFNRKKQKYALVDFGLAQEAPVKRQVVEEPEQTDLNRKTSRNTQENQKDTPNSPRKRKHNSTEKDTSQPLSKRPLIESINQGNVEKSKRKSFEKDTTDMKRSEIHNQKPVLSYGNTNVLTPPTPDIVHYSKGLKSPRRMLLTKRALDLSRTKHVIETGNRPGTSGTGQRRTVVINSGGKSMFKSVSPSACQCFGQPMVCSLCVARPSQNAPRAGTPGFRAPEVLMKCPEQSTAVDIWAAGVIFLSLLSGRYPFFKANDDMTALAQIISIFGTEAVKKAAKTYGKHLNNSPNIPNVSMKILCEKLRGCGKTSKGGKSKKTRQDEESWECVPDSAYELLTGLLDLDPNTRITADAALKHSFFS